MVRRYSDVELTWRYRTWRKQLVKELVRMMLRFHYEPHHLDVELAGNVNEDEHDSGWRFPLPLVEVQGQLRDLNARLNADDQYTEWDFWRERSDAD